LSVGKYPVSEATEFARDLPGVEARRPSSKHPMRAGQRAGM
jgi:hypothetical protein